MANVGEATSTEEMELISHYFHLGYEYEVILEFLKQYHDVSLSMRSLKRKLREYGLRRNANDVDEPRLRNIIRSELRCSGGSLGYRAVWYSLRLEHKVHVPRRLVAEIIREMDPEGVQNRRRRRSFNTLSTITTKIRTSVQLEPTFTTKHVLHNSNLVITFHIYGLWKWREGTRAHKTSIQHLSTG